MKHPRTSVALPVLVLLALLSVDCSLLFKPSEVQATPDSVAWSGCYRGGTPDLGLILEPILSADGSPTSALTGCLGLRLGTPERELYTVEGFAESAEELLLRSADLEFPFTRDEVVPATPIDDTVSLTFEGEQFGPVPRCSQGFATTCEEILN